MIESLKKYFGYDKFRPLQQEIVSHLIERKDCLVLMPTGGGKSICFQLPAMMLPGTAVVISPLISLMKDQVDALESNGIRAAALNSSASAEENQRLRKQILAGEIKLLYLSPEKLIAEKDYLLSQIEISLFAIDEAHCISQWGHDFRPEYTQLSFLHQDFPGVPIAAFTATADKVTRRDIVSQLRLKPDNEGEVKVFMCSFDRPNLSLDVRRGYNAKEKFKAVEALIRRHPHESGIIYCLSRNTTEKLALKLQEAGINAQAYHAGLENDVRARVQDDFLQEKVNVVCATIAFGMGIDKSNVRFVAHYNLPKSIESYYQEIGRGGRDGLNCETVLFYNVGDIIMLRKFAQESGQSECNYTKLERMQKYAESQICRRRILLNYFGENMDHDCGNCDVCQNPPQRFDGTIEVQKVLSAIMRTGQAIGFGTVIDIVRGLCSPEITAMRYDQIKTFGVGRDHTQREWQDYLLQMIQLGFLEIDDRENSHLKVTNSGKDVLYGRTKAELAVVDHKDFAVKGREKRQAKGERDLNDLSEEEDDLFQVLRGLRRELAKDQKVAAFVIFSDKSLREMAVRKPTTLDAFQTISGVGTHKIEQYGERFVAEIQQFVATKS